MNSQHYADLLPKDFDKFDCVKISPLVYIALIFVLKAYVVWLMTITNMQDRLSIIQFIYPNKWVFFVNLASGALGVIALLVLTLRRPEAPHWVRTLWRHFRVLLISAMFFDLTINIVAVWLWGIGHFQWIFVMIIASIIISASLMRSKRLSINLQEFPEKLPE